MTCGVDEPVKHGDQALPVRDLDNIQYSGKLLIETGSKVIIEVVETQQRVDYWNESEQSPVHHSDG